MEPEGPGLHPKGKIPTSARGHHLLQEGGPLPGPKRGSCLTGGNELSEEMHVLTKLEALLGGDARPDSSSVREPGRTALPHGSQPRVLW